MFKELNIMELFFQTPKREFSVREAAKLMKVAPATASKELQHLASVGLLTVRDDRLAKLYAANLGNEAYRDLKKYHTIRKLKDSGVIEAVNEVYNNPEIILVGQAAEGSDTESSSIDIVVLSGKKEAFQEKKKFEQKLGRQLHIFAAENLSEVDSSVLRNASWTVIQGAKPISEILSVNTPRIIDKTENKESLQRRYIQ